MSTVADLLDEQEFLVGGTRKGRHPKGAAVGAPPAGAPPTAMS
jgi:hypothetical protein